MSVPELQPHLSIILVGLSHHTAPVELREQFTLSKEALEPSLLDLQSGLRECAILSTCNRLEVYALAGDREQGWRAIEGFLAGLYGHPLEHMQPHLYRMSGAETIDHLLRVACGLDSMILGETQILGQVVAALTEAKSAGTIGSVMWNLFTRAIHAGKRARTETSISRHTTSISHAAAKIAQAQLGDLAGCHVLIIGAGEMAELAARAMQMRGAAQITFVNRTYERAEALAQSLSFSAADWVQIDQRLAQADVIISATSAPHIVLQASQIEGVLAARSSRPLLILDIAVPRDVDPAVGALPGVRCFNIDDLQAALDENQAERQAAVPQVEAIIDQEQHIFLDWLHSREVAPVISDLYRHALAVVEAEIERTLNKLDDLTPQEKKIVSQLGYRIANKLLHEPTVRLKAAATEGSGLSYAHLIRELFALQEAHGADVYPPEEDHAAVSSQGAWFGE